jgi:hypothetical protein
MHPSPIADTAGPFFPNVRVFIVSYAGHFHAGSVTVQRISPLVASIFEIASHSFQWNPVSLGNSRVSRERESRLEVCLF